MSIVARLTHTWQQCEISWNVTSFHWVCIIEIHLIQSFMSVKCQNSLQSHPRLCTVALLSSFWTQHQKVICHAKSVFSEAATEKKNKEMGSYSVCSDSFGWNDKKKGPLWETRTGKYIKIKTAQNRPDCLTDRWSLWIAEQKINTPWQRALSTADIKYINK